MHIELKRLDGDFHFEALAENGNSIHFDASPDIGGTDKGVRPMQALIMAMGACSAIDIILILKKQRQVITDFAISIDAEREQDKQPALWKSAVLHFKFKGEVDQAKAERAVQLSMEKYCSVSKTLELAGTTLTYKTTVNG